MFYVFYEKHYVCSYKYSIVYHLNKNMLLYFRFRELKSKRDSDPRFSNSIYLHQ